ncbi:MAG: hypothetical protein Q7S87_19340 [Agitococcus sp.]|nr:hypothetical protein [Agitococcus sp.]
MKTYKPRRATKRWTEGAPEYILDCFDNKGKTNDRYTILFGGTLLEPSLLANRSVHFLGLSAVPSHPQGFSQWGEISASFRPAHWRVRWLDLPEDIRKHIIARATSQ